MRDATLKLTFDGRALEAQLAALSELAERLPEVRDGLLGLFESGEELFVLHSDGRSASTTGEIVVRLDPSDALLGFLAAFGAGDSDLFLFEHGASPQVEFRHHITTSHPPQSGGCP